MANSINHSSIVLKAQQYFILLDALVIIHSIKGISNTLTPKTYNQFHNILRLLDVLANFHFTTSETMGDYYLETWYIRVVSGVAEQLKT